MISKKVLRAHVSFNEVSEMFHDESLNHKAEWINTTESLGQNPAARRRRACDGWLFYVLAKLH